MSDSIADMLTIIRNAQAVGRAEVKVPYSNIRWNIAELMFKKEFIAGAEKKGRGARRVIEISLKYKDNSMPVIKELRRVSKPGRRIYAKKSGLMNRRTGRNFVVSTPKGLMLDSDARKAQVGGEILFEIWT